MEIFKLTSNRRKLLYGLHNDKHKQTDKQPHKQLHKQTHKQTTTQTNVESRSLASAALRNNRKAGEISACSFVCLMFSCRLHNNLIISFGFYLKVVVHYLNEKYGWHHI